MNRHWDYIVVVSSVRFVVTVCVLLHSSCDSVWTDCDVVGRIDVVYRCLAVVTWNTNNCCWKNSLFVVFLFVSFACNDNPRTKEICSLARIESYSSNCRTNRFFYHV